MSNHSYQPHHILLRDVERTTAFRRAVEAMVRPGDVVIDLGAGSGILSLFAARAGARKVFALEIDPTLCGLIAALAEENGFGDVIEPICTRSQDFTTDLRADVLVCDAMGFFGISEEMEAFFELRDRLAKPGARLVPAGVRLYAAPVQAHDIYDWIDLRTSDQYGLVLNSAARASIAGVYAVKLDHANLLAPPQLVGEVDMRTGCSSRIAFAANFTSLRDGTLHGLGGWFEAELSPGCALRSGPFTNRAMGRSRLFVSPRAEPVSAGDALAFVVETNHQLSFWRQRVADRDWTEQSSLAAHPGWQALSFAASPWPARLPSACIAAAADRTGVANFGGTFEDARQIDSILAAAVGESTGAFVGLS